MHSRSRACLNRSKPGNWPAGFARTHWCWALMAERHRQHPVMRALIYAALLALLVTGLLWKLDMQRALRLEKARQPHFRRGAAHGLAIARPERLRAVLRGRRVAARLCFANAFLDRRRAASGVRPAPGVGRLAAPGRRGRQLS